MITASGTLYSTESLEEAKALRESLIARCVTEWDAKTDGFRSITSVKGAWAIRRYAQCTALAKAIEELGPVEFRLVLKEGRISIWRKK